MTIHQGTLLLCQHALTAAAAVIVDVPPVPATRPPARASTMAQQIADRIVK
ncbi:MAG: hypothetical protein WBV64_09705 [Mycobacterium sp.]